MVSYIIITKEAVTVHSELCQKLEIQQSAGSVGIPLCPYISTCMFPSQWEYAQLFFCNSVLGITIPFYLKLTHVTE